MTSTADLFAAGDPESLDALVRLLRPRVRAIVCRCVHDPNDRDDVEQRVWEKYFALRHTIREPARTVGWLRTTALREAIRAASETKYEYPSELVDDAPDDSAPVDDNSARADRDRDLWWVVERLPERDRRLARMLAHQPGLSTVDIARRLGVAPGSMGQVRTRFRRRLRRKLAEVEITGADL